MRAVLFIYFLKKQCITHHVSERNSNKFQKRNLMAKGKIFLCFAFQKNNASRKVIEKIISFFLSVIIMQCLRNVLEATMALPSHYTGNPIKEKGAFTGGSRVLPSDSLWHEEGRDRRKRRRIVSFSFFHENWNY